LTKLLRYGGRKKERGGANGGTHTGGVSSIGAISDFARREETNLRRLSARWGPPALTSLEKGKERGKEGGGT